MNRKFTFLSILFLIILLQSGCTKSDLTELITSYNKVKIYNDTLADPRNRAIRIAAGNDRLLMTYCYDFEKFNAVNGVFSIPPHPRTQWMLTDNEGNIIKRDSFPTGLTIADVVFLKDNRFMAIVYDANQGFSGPNYKFEYFLYDQNGQKIASDSLHFPAGVTLTGPSMDDHQILHLTHSLSGNPLMYFEYYDQNYAQLSFAGELNADGSFIWYKIYANTKITGCVSTPDGGYIFSGSDIGDYYNQLPGYTSVMKTSSTGDSLWTKTFNAVNPANIQITTGDNGNYFFCFNDSLFFVYEINALGDSLNAFATNEVGLNMPAALIPKNGGVFTLINKDLTIYTFDGKLTNQVNTHFICLNGGLNVIQKGVFQKESTDMIFAGCKTSDGKIACFGLTQIYERRYYKPELIIVN